MISKLTVVSLLVLTVFALHIEHEQLNVTGGTSIEQAVSDFTAFNKSVFANTAYSQKITDNQAFSEFLTRALEKEMADLYLVEASLIPIVAVNKNSCSNLTVDERNELIKKLECVQKNLMNLTSYLEKQGNATIQQELYRRASLQYIYVE